MAASKIDHTVSIATARPAANSVGVSARTVPAPEKATPIAEPWPTLIYDSAAMNRRWRLRMLRMGFALLIGFEILYFLIDAPRTFGAARATAMLHLAAIAVSGAALAATCLELFERNARLIVFVALATIFVVTLDLALFTHEMTPLLMTVALGLIGSAAAMSWGTRWQGALTLTALAAVAMPTLTIAPHDAHTAYLWLTFLMAAALGYFIVLVTERNRAELERWTKSVEVSNERLRQSEAELRKVLEASGDAITISRLSDGRYLDFNQCFCDVTGFTREEALGHTAAELNIWLDRNQLKSFLRQLQAQGQIRNMECAFRSKGGTVFQHLLSASLMELEGEQCVVVASRDVTGIKRTEAKLRAAHDELSSRVGALNESQDRLRNEIAERERAQQLLAESEGTLRQIFAASPDIIGVNRLSDGRFVEVNDEFIRVTGYSRAEATAANARQLRLFKTHDHLREVMRILRSDGLVRNFETELRTKDGTLIPHLFSATVINLSGKPCIISFIRDISAIKQAELELRATQRELSAQVEALHSSEEQLRAEITERALAQQRLAASETKLRRIFETSVDVITVSRFPERYLVDCNPEFLSLTGLSREEALSLRIEEMGIWRRREQYREFLRRLREYGFVRNMEMELARRDGTTKQSLISATLTDIDGQPHVVTIGRDISELKQTEDDLRAAERVLSSQVAELHRSQEQLRAEIAEREFTQRRLIESERKFRRVFESSLDAIAIINVASWQIIDCNAELTRILGYERGQLIGRTTEELNIWASNSTLREVTKRLLDVGMVRNLELEFRHSSGVFAPYLFSAVVAEFDGRPCVMAVTRDISQLKRTERELIAAREAALAASRAKSEFLSSMSHEIRTPMNAILGMADLLWETTLDAEQRRYLHTMRANGDALLSLVNDILDLAKVESGRLSLERSECDLVALAEGAIETLATRAHEKGLELALDVQPEVPVTILIDSLRVRQILVNLLGNAIKFTERGEVTLTVEAAASEQGQREPAFVDSRAADGAATEAETPLATERRLLRFTVRDTGIGIPAEKIETIFASFTQADSTTTRKYGGSGLGLAIVKRLVDLMGGRLTVESDPGRGSTFSFIAPFEISAGTPTVKERARKVRRLAGARLLVVDDSSTNRRILSGMLVMGGATVTGASDGSSAIAEIRSARAAGKPYDVVLADCGMPWPDGAGIGRYLRAGATAHEALVLILTGDDLPSRLGRLRDMGFGEDARCLHLIKPVRRADLYGVITAVRSGTEWNRGLRAYSNGTGVGGPKANGSIAPSPTARPAANGAARLGSRRRAILLAEDSPDNRLVIEAYLKNTPCVVDHAENGEIAVRKFIEGHYDAVLMDIQMPVMDGYTATAGIRRWERENNRPPTPIIALTASAGNEAKRRSLQTGCNAHVTKPVKRATLLKAINEAVEPHGPNKLYAEGNMSVPNQSSGAPKPPAKCSAKKCGDAQDRIIVHIDEELRDIVPGFLDRKRQDAAAILTASERREGEVISRLGHKLKGEGGGYGLDVVSTLGCKLEQAAAEGDFAATAGLARELVSFLDRLEIVYQPMDD